MFSNKQNANMTVGIHIKTTVHVVIKYQKCKLATPVNYIKYMHRITLGHAFIRPLVIGRRLFQHKSFHKSFFIPLTTRVQSFLIIACAGPQI